MRLARWDSAFRWVAAIALALPAWSCFGQEVSLDQLARDYRDYGLPAPTGAKLAILTQGQQRQGQARPVKHLVLLVREPSKSDRGAYWNGLTDTPVNSNEQVRLVDPEKIDFSTTTRLRQDSWTATLSTFPDLALAIHCKIRGWHNLEEQLLRRSRLPRPVGYFANRRRPRNDRAALALLAWNYYFNQFSIAGGDQRRTIIDNMKRLRGSNLGLTGKQHGLLLEDMRATIQPRKPAGDPLEAAIEGLLELDKPPKRLRQMHLLLSLPEYRKLKHAGLDAVPVLVRHLDDFRLTRFMASSRYGYTRVRHYRIADVVADLLDGIAGEPFAYDLLRAEGRGRRLDARHVAYWRKNVSKKNELQHLLSKAVTRQSDSIAVKPELLQQLGRKYPDEFVKLFKKHEKDNHNSTAMFTALGASKVPDRVKAELFLRAANGTDTWKQMAALRELADMKHPQASLALIRALKRIPKTPSVPYWRANTGSIAQIVGWVSDDAAWSALVKTARRVDVGQRMEILAAVGNLRGKGRARAVAALRQFLNDNEWRDLNAKAQRTADDPLGRGLFEGPCAGFIYPRLRVADFTALQLAELLKMEVAAKPEWKTSDWDRLRSRVGVALKRYDRKDK